MNRLVIVGSGAVAALAVSALLGSGVASADGYAGQTYSDASKAASDAGQTVVVASRVGGVLDESDCLVARSQTAPFTSANDGVRVANTVQFYLNCNGGVASATKPGNSLGSEEGRAARAAELKAQQDAADQEAAALEAASTPDV